MIPTYYSTSVSGPAALFFLGLVVLVLVALWLARSAGEGFDRLRHPRRTAAEQLDALSPEAFDYRWRDRLTLHQRRSEHFAEPLRLHEPSDLSPFGFPISAFSLDAEHEFITTFSRYLARRRWPAEAAPILAAYGEELGLRAGLLALRRRQLAAVAARRPGDGEPALAPFVPEERRLIAAIEGAITARLAAERVIRGRSEAAASAEKAREE